MTAYWQTCDVFDGLAQLESGSIDLVITSPPFLALRSYLPADHPDKGKEIGSESTPAEFLDVMLRFTAELRRVVAPHGSIAIELGDTYSGMQSGDSDGRLSYRAHINGLRDTQERPKRDTSSSDWPLAKSKTLIPELYRIALAYGINPLTGAESPAGRWRVRNVVTWCRPNPPVGALGDKWRPATSDVVVACTSDRRFWDDLATRRPYSPASLARALSDAPGHIGVRHESGIRSNDEPTIEAPYQLTQAGAPLLDYWVIPPTGYAGAHYAVYPPALVVPLVKAMCPSRVCRVCGEPSRRIVEWDYEDDPRRPGPRGGVGAGREDLTGQNHRGINDPSNRQMVKVPRHTAVSDCGHDDWRPGLVLDPFAGSGTTLLVAQGHGHDAIGIDLDPRNLELARERVGPMFLEEVESV